MRYEKPGDPYVRVRLSDGRVVREHRFIMECKLGRKLSPSEHVHHKDLNPRNNEESNLELKSRADHCRLHRPVARKVRLRCPTCGCCFERTARYVRSKKKLGQHSFFCGRSCRGPRGGETTRKVTAHGSRGGYLRGCRCAECREAQAHYMREYRSKGLW